MNISLLRPYNSKELENAVIRVIRSGRHIGGSEISSFEEEFADYIGTKYAVSVNSATSAEMLTLLALGVKPGESTADMEYYLETVACIGACALAPTMTINDETHGQMTAKKAGEMFHESNEGD